MIKFFLKKNFCDIWDNLFFLILSNIIPVAVVVGAYFGISYIGSINSYAPNIAFIVFSGILMAVIFAWGANARKLADFNSPTFGLFFRSLASLFFKGFIFGSLLAVLVLISRVAILYYLNNFFNNSESSSFSYLSLFLAAVIGWFVIIVCISMQWFVPFYFLQEENNMFKCLKKSFIIFFDNPGFSFFIFLHNIVLLILTIVTFGLIPGVNGITLSCTNALRLRLYKYDWLEEHEEYLNDRDKRNEVPWNELIADDVESLGPRKFSSFIFPWK